MRTVICRRCGLVYSDPRPNAGEIRDYYERQYRVDYKATVQPKPQHVYRGGKVAVERFRRLPPIFKRGCRVLDFGAGGGEFVFVMRAMGYEVSGFEPTAEFARFASETLGLPVVHGFYQEIQIEPGSIDLVTAYHVMEHLESPYDALRRVRDWLRPDGHLLVEVPNVETVCQWPRSRFHRAHLYNFSPAALEMAGRKAGYRVVSSLASSAGGNITVVFQKENAVTAVSGEVPGNFARVSGIVRGHTFFRHLFTRHPYVRPFHRLATWVDGRRAVCNATSPKEILEGLIARELRQE